MDTFARPAEGAKIKSQVKIKSQSQSQSQIKRSQPSAALQDWVFSVRNLVGCQAAIAGKPAPTVGSGVIS
jgi:hypothetical protein